MDFAASTWSGLIGALVGSIVGSILSYVFTRRIQKVTLSFDFHRELNTLEMGRHRAIGEKLIRQYPFSDYNQLNAKDEIGTDSLFVLMRFFERLGLAVRFKQVDADLVCEMFASNFYYWYLISFKSGLEKDSSSAYHIAALHQWFYKSIGLEKHKKWTAENEEKLLKWQEQALDRVASVLAT